MTCYIFIIIFFKVISVADKFDLQSIGYKISLGNSTTRSISYSELEYNY